MTVVAFFEKENRYVLNVINCKIYFSPIYDVIIMSLLEHSVYFKIILKYIKLFLYFVANDELKLFNYYQDDGKVFLLISIVEYMRVIFFNLVVYLFFH